MSVHYTDATVTVHHGDCLDVLRELPDASVDAVVTDPPYGLEFMGKDWDAPWKASSVGRGVRVETERAGEMTERGKGHSTAGGPYLAARVDSVRVAGLPFQQWCEQWAVECLRVLKPGGHLLAFGGTRTWHRLACAVEDAGFEVRDSIAWLYGSGFPKSLDVSKAIDKRAEENTETKRRIALVAEVIRTHREAKGMERAAVSLAVVGTPSGACWNWEHHQLPSIEMWPAIKATLDIPDDFDGLIEGDRAQFIAAERAVLRERTMTQGGGTSLQLRMGEAREVRVDITAPATDDARTWQGWGTALKPAFEPVVVARKPLAGTVAKNVLEWGCGALNIDGTRIQSDGGSGQGISREETARGCRVHDLRPMRDADGALEVAGRPGQVADDVRTDLPGRADARGEQSQLARRSLDGQPLRVPGRVGAEPIPGRSGTSTEAAAPRVPGAPSSDGAAPGQTARGGRDGAPPERGQGGQPARESASDRLGHSLEGARPDRTGSEPPSSGERPPAGCTCGTDAGVTPAGRWPANVVLDESQAAELDQQSGEVGGNSTGPGGIARRAYTTDRTVYTGNDTGTPYDYGDTGGASRFFYVAKADASERIRIDGTAHPTVKPLALMRWLVRLVTPPGGTVLEPFAGSGTTVEACILEGFRCIAIEREADYLPLILQRIHRRRDPVAAVRGSGEDGGLFDLLDGEGA